MEKVAVQSSRIRKGGPDPRLEPAQKKFDGENTFFLDDRKQNYTTTTAYSAADATINECSHSSLYTLANAR